MRGAKNSIISHRSSPPAWRTMPNHVIQQKMRLIELMRENCWMVDKNHPHFKNRDRKMEKWEEIAAILGEEGICLDLDHDMFE